MLTLVWRKLYGGFIIPKLKNDNVAWCRLDRRMVPQGTRVQITRAGNTLCGTKMVPPNTPIEGVVMYRDLRAWFALPSDPYRSLYRASIRSWQFMPRKVGRFVP